MKEILSYFPDLTNIQQEQFKRFSKLYSYWNGRINLISRKDIGNLYVHHVLHSLSLARVIHFKPGTRIMDAGTGGGFPGVPLAVCFPLAHFHLVDSIGKKINAVNAIANQLGLKNISVEQNRIENVTQRFDFIVSRAVASLPVFLAWCKDLIYETGNNEMRNGIFYLKGGDLAGEIKSIRQEFQVFPIHTFFSEPFFQEKVILYFPQ